VRGAIKGTAAAAHLRGLLLPSTDPERTGTPSNEVPGPAPPAVFDDGAPEKVVKRIAPKPKALTEIEAHQIAAASPIQDIGPKAPPCSGHSESS
jgi:hypothetical protein